MGISCGCSCGFDDGEYPEFSKETFPKARKEYICCECGGKIKPGDKCHNVTGKWDGRMKTFRTCMACYHIREQYFNGRCVFMGLREAINDCFGFDYLEVPDEEE